MVTIWISSSQSVVGGPLNVCEACQGVPYIIFVLL
jgi:hypothetical protein